jgi:hypothetical protein
VVPWSLSWWTWSELPEHLKPCSASLQHALADQTNPWHHNIHVRAHGTAIGILLDTVDDSYVHLQMNIHVQKLGCDHAHASERARIPPSDVDATVLRATASKQHAVHAFERVERLQTKKRGQCLGSEIEQGYL